MSDGFWKPTVVIECDDVTIKQARLISKCLDKMEKAGVAFSHDATWSEEAEDQEEAA